MTYRISDEIEDALTPEVIAAGWDKFREGRQSQPMLQLLAGGPGLKEVFIAMAAAMRGFRIVRADETREAFEKAIRAQAMPLVYWIAQACHRKAPSASPIWNNELVSWEEFFTKTIFAELDKESEPKK